MNLTDQQIKEIADNLDCGMRCFYNHTTGEVLSLVNNNDWMGAEKEFLEDDFAEIQNNRDNYFEFDRPTTHDSFQIMADFAELTEDYNFQRRLINALQKSKPFRNFKWEIDNSGEFREKWFAFKNQKSFEHVKLRVEKFNVYNK